jgi:uncharacterized protein DUF397
MIVNDDLRWQRSSFCGSNACVEIAMHGATVVLGDSKDPDRAPLTFTREEWGAFIQGVQAGEFS